jgi:hypothetical protein
VALIKAATIGPADGTGSPPISPPAGCGAGDWARDGMVMHPIREPAFEDE